MATPCAMTSTPHEVLKANAAWRSISTRGVEGASTSATEMLQVTSTATEYIITQRGMHCRVNQTTGE